MLTRNSLWFSVAQWKEHAHGQCTARIVDSIPKHRPRHHLHHQLWARIQRPEWHYLTSTMTGQLEWIQKWACWNIHEPWYSSYTSAHSTPNLCPLIERRAQHSASSLTTGTSYHNPSSQPLEEKHSQELRPVRAQCSKIIHPLHYSIIEQQLITTSTTIVP